MKQEAPRQRRSRTGIPAIHGREHVKDLGYTLREIAQRTGIPLRYVRRDLLRDRTAS